MKPAAFTTFSSINRRTSSHSNSNSGAINSLTSFVLCVCVCVCLFQYLSQAFITSDPQPRVIIIAFRIFAIVAASFCLFYLRPNVLHGVLCCICNIPVYWFLPISMIDFAPSANLLPHTTLGASLDRLDRFTLTKNPSESHRFVGNDA